MTTFESAVINNSGLSYDVIQSTRSQVVNTLEETQLKFAMSVRSNSPCLSSDNESEESYNVEDVMSIPYDDQSEPLATEEDSAAYNAEMEREAELKQEYQRRYNREVSVDTW